MHSAIYGVAKYGELANGYHLGCFASLPGVGLVLRQTNLRFVFTISFSGLWYDQ